MNGHKIVVVLPAYNAAGTLRQTHAEIPHDIVDEIVLVDDFSSDDTAVLARQLGISHIIEHRDNKGYGANQKSCYEKAMSLGADIIIMLHPDYQYTPKLITAMASVIAHGVYPVVLGSRILGKGALNGGMPPYKFAANRILTFVQNILTGYKLSEYHTGYRAFHRKVLEAVPWNENAEGFLFDNEMLSQIIYAGHDIAEVTCPTHYSSDTSSINFAQSVRYGLGVLGVSCKHFLQRKGLVDFALYKKKQNTNA